MLKYQAEAQDFQNIEILEKTEGASKFDFTGQSRTFRVVATGNTYTATREFCDTFGDWFWVVRLNDGTEKKYGSLQSLAKNFKA